MLMDVKAFRSLETSIQVQIVIHVMFNDTLSVTQMTIASKQQSLSFSS